MSRPVCGNCFCTYDDDGTCGCPDDQAHYKKVIDDVQALFEAKREEAALWQAAYETEKGFREQEQQELASASVKLVSTSVEPHCYMDEYGNVHGSYEYWMECEGGWFPVYTSPQPASKPHDCARSHPHENMDAMCELRTEIARLTNENARLKAQPSQSRSDVKPWVGLTEADIEEAINANCGTGLWSMAVDIEAKLREKNQ